MSVFVRKADIAQVGFVNSEVHCCRRRINTQKASAVRV